MAVKPVPEGYHTVTPYLTIEGAAQALEFYQQAFGACERLRLTAPDGRIGHAEIVIGDSAIMLADECAEGFGRNPLALGGTPVAIHLYVEDVDARFAQAVQAGAEVIHPVQDQFYGDRTGTLRDPFGHVWFFATHKEDLSQEEIGRRAVALFKQTSS